MREGRAVRRPLVQDPATGYWHEEEESTAALSSAASLRLGEHQLNMLRTPHNKTSERLRQIIAAEVARLRGER